MFTLVVGLAPLPFAILCFATELSIFLPHSVLKVAGVSSFSYQQLIQAIAGDSGHGLAYEMRSWTCICIE